MRLLCGNHPESVKCTELTSPNAVEPTSIIGRVPHRILLVEDDRKLAPLVRRFLEDHHFEVGWAADGNEGWRDFRRFEPDLVVLDPDRVGSGPVETHHDLPAGAGRLGANAIGIEHVIVNGVHTVADGIQTGRSGGRALRLNS